MIEPVRTRLFKYVVSSVLVIFFFSLSAEGKRSRKKSRLRGGSSCSRSEGGGGGGGLQSAVGLIFVVCFLLCGGPRSGSAAAIRRVRARPTCCRSWSRRAATGWKPPCPPAPDTSRRYLRVFNKIRYVIEGWARWRMTSLTVNLVII